MANIATIGGKKSSKAFAPDDRDLVSLALLDGGDEDAIPPEHDLIASICRESFYSFVQEFWSVVSQEKPVWNWHIEYICNEMQIVAERVFKGLPKEYDLIINVPPSTSKSTICSIMFPAWTWTRMRHCRNIGASYSYDLAVDLSSKSRNVIKSDKYKRCFPDVSIREDQDSKGYFINEQGGDRLAVGVNGSVMGKHGHFLLVDDPIDPLESISEASLKTVNLWMTETLPSRKVDSAVSVMILIMQRLAQSDPSAEKYSKRLTVPVKLICLPAELTDDVAPKICRLFYEDGLLDPVRLNKKTLAEKMADLGEYGYAGQFLQNPVARGGGMFLVDRISIELFPPPPHMFRKICRFWDKAGSKTSSSAWSVGVLMGQTLDGMFWVLDVIRGRWNSSVRERTIKETAERDGRQILVGIEQEPGSGGKEQAESTVRALAGWNVQVWKVGKSDGDKEARAQPFSVQVNHGHVYLRKAPWNDEYLKEMRFFPVSKFKDQVDSSSGAFHFLTRPIIRVGGAW